MLYTSFKAPTIKKLKLFDVRLWDGAGGHKHSFYTESEEFAQEWKRLNTYDYVANFELVVINSMDEYNRFRNDNNIESIKRKLTDQELAVLGLKR